MALTLEPALGGAITRLTHRGQDLLRPTPPNPADVLETAGFPLIPYANRIARGAFRFAGREVRIAPNMGDHPHPLHGEGWRGPWTVTEAGAATARLTFEGGPEWPWPYRAKQRFELAADALTLRLAITSLAVDPAPAGLGFHPYFPIGPGARLTAATTGRWAIDADGLPSGWSPAQPFAAGAPLPAAELIDHCHTGWTGAARLALGEGRPTLDLTASPELPFLHVFAPPGAGFACLEPVSHRPDALNAQDPPSQGLRILAPGETLEVWMKLAVV